MLHLPALQKSGAINSLSQNLSKLGLTIRGLYGEGTKPKGAIYQLSNQITLGISEETAIANLKNIATQIAAQEEAMRQNLLQSPDIQDALSRSVGMLKYCRVINHAEAVELLSNLRFALAVEMIDGINIADIDALMEKIQPANILLGGGVATPEERDKKRAEIIHEALRGL
jgi:protein arginine kinase